jgi:hypothetical protein
MVCTLDTTRFHVLLETRYPLNVEELQRNHRCLKSCDRDFWTNTIVCAIKSHRIPLDEVKAYLRLRPKSYGILPDAFLSLFRSKLLRLMKFQRFAGT